MAWGSNKRLQPCLVSCTFFQTVNWRKLGCARWIPQVKSLQNGDSRLETCLPLGHPQMALSDIGQQPLFRLQPPYPNLRVFCSHKVPIKQHQLLLVQQLNSTLLKISSTSQATRGSASHSSMAQALSTEPAQHQESALLAKLQISSNQLSSKHTHTEPQSKATLASADRVAAALPTTAPSTSATTAASCTPSSGVTFTDAGHATPPQPEEHQQEWLEAVEVKNVCPFREVREVASNGKAKRLYRLSDPGPYSRVSLSSHLNPVSNSVLGLRDFGNTCRT